MATGAVHAMVARNIMFTTWVGSAAAVGVVGLPISISLGLSVGALAGLIVTPDSDIENPTHEDARVYHRYGEWAGKAWEWFWMDYAEKMTHRGLSHKPFYGTWTRWEYVLKRVVLPILIVLTMIMPDWLFMFSPMNVVHAVLFTSASYLMHSIQDIAHLWKDGWKYHGNL